MPKICYTPKNFRPASLEMIELANAIIDEYEAQGYDLTLRQLYYQMVSRGIIENNMREYKNLGSLINDARLAGLIDWDRITDRTRNLRSLSHFESPADVINAARWSYRLDKWKTQKFRVEVWVEKDALAGVIQRICNKLDLPYFSCRGYTSQSEMWAAGMRLQNIIAAGQTPIILHLGDHDPSGVDMTRDIFARLKLFMGGTKVTRLALNWNQVEEYRPPPNPAKLTDSRATAYIEEFGPESWELDALEPSVISDLIENATLQYQDVPKWNATVKIEKEGVTLLEKAVKQWDRIARSLAA